MLLLSLLSPIASAASQENARAAVMRRVGPNDAVILVDPGGRVLFEKNADRMLVPASILKLFTALVVLDALGENFHYVTEVYMDDRHNVTIKGYGDPLLISEVVADISRQLAQLLSGEPVLNSLRLDESYFVQQLTIPGVTDSSQPYDAPNGALCVNFNTVHFRRSEGRYISAEPQTPLLPFALERIRSREAKGGRVVLSPIKHENTLYAGALFRYFLEQEGLRFDGSIKIGKLGPADQLVLTYQSPYALTSIIAKLLEHSNNFITNQLLITAGARTHGAPGSLKKGLQTARRFARANLGIEGLNLVEGSGISRQNKISARQMITVLKHFEPYHQLMRFAEKEFYKTGTLRGISTRAGYLVGANTLRYPFVVMFNTPGKAAPNIMPYLREMIQ